MKETDVLKISSCLKQNKEKILALWSEKARQELPAAHDKSELVLRDAIPLFVDNLVRAFSPLEPPFAQQQAEVSREHGLQRAEQRDYSLDQVLTEYFLLQRTILDVLEVETESPLTSAVRDIILESIATGIKEAGVVFAERQMAHLYRSNEALEHFAHIASHDLQEPIRMITMQLELLGRKMGPDLNEKHRANFDSAIEGARRLRSLVESLLLYSQLGQTREKFVKVDFNVAVSNAISNLEMVINDSRAKITADMLPTLEALPVEIERLFQNLISNAIKFHGNEPPVIHITATPSQRGWVFSVRDNGIGVAVGHENKIFKLFTRLHSKDEIPGSGIGLSVCRRVAELHDGTIWAEPNPAGGAIFKFSIPNPPN